MMVLDVAGCNGYVGVLGVAGHHFRLIQPVQKKKRQITLLVARSTTLVLLKYTSAGATRENTCSTLSFGVSLQEHVLLTPRPCSEGRIGIRSGVFAGR
jgi:hypothetical protein